MYVLLAGGRHLVWRCASWRQAGEEGEHFIEFVARMTARETAPTDAPKGIKQVSRRGASGRGWEEQEKEVAHLKCIYMNVCAYLECVGGVGVSY